MHYLFQNVVERSIRKLHQTLKYLHISFHDTNLSNILRFLQYFDTHGYDKYVRFSSSVRFEIMKDKFANNDSRAFWIRIVFDNEEVKLPFCKQTYCTYNEFKNYF